MSINVNTLAAPATVSAQIVSASNANLQQNSTFTKVMVHDGTNLGYRNYIRGFGEIYIFGNTAITPVGTAVVNTMYQFTGVYIVNPLSVNFDASGNGLRYLGIPLAWYPYTGTFYVHASFNAYTPATGIQSCSFYLAVNGTILNNSKCSQSMDNGKPQNGLCSAIVSLTTGDIVTFWMANNTSGNSILIVDLSLEAIALN